MYRNFYYSDRMIFLFIALCLCFTFTLKASNIIVSAGVHYQVIEDEDCPAILQVVKSDSYLDMDKISIDGEMDVKDNMFFSPTRKAVVKRIGSSAFSNCNNLKEIYLPTTIEWIDDNAFSLTGLINLTLPEGIIYLGRRAFYSPDLEELRINESVKVVDFQCFAENRNLQKVFLPSSLQVLGGYTFFGCADITDIYCYAMIPPIAADNDFGFLTCSEYYPWDSATHPYTDLCTLHVPRASIEAYRSAEGWENFTNIVAVEDDITEIVTVEAELSGIDYYINNGVLYVNCSKGDVVALFNESGHRLDSKNINKRETYTYSGNGIYILKVNETAVKVMI